MSDLTLARFIGGDFHNISGLSPWGRLYRICRLNGLTIGQTISALGVPDEAAVLMRTQLSFPISYGDMALDDLNGHALAHTWPGLADLIPYEVDPCRTTYAVKEMRACASCLKSGYHSIVHLMSWIHYCPWHNEKLINRCICGTSLGWNLGSLRRPMMACSCGHDPYDRLMGLASLTSWPEDKVVQCIREILDKAKVMRSTRRLFDGNSGHLHDKISALHPAPNKNLCRLCTTVSDKEIDSADNALMKKIVLKWDECGRSIGHDFLPIAPQHAALNDAFKRNLAKKIISEILTENHHPHSPIDVSKPFGAIDESEQVVRAKFLSNVSWKIGHELIRKFLDNSFNGKAEEFPSWKRTANLHAALLWDSAEISRLGLTLSAIAMHTDASRWILRIWRVFAKKTETCPYWIGDTMVLSQNVRDASSLICSDLNVHEEYGSTSVGRRFSFLVGDCIEQIGLQPSTYAS